MYKIDVDGSISEKSLWKCIGVIIRNSNGDVMAAMAMLISCLMTPLSIQLFAVKEAIKFSNWH